MGTVWRWVLWLAMTAGLTASQPVFQPVLVVGAVFDSNLGHPVAPICAESCAVSNLWGAPGSAHTASVAAVVHDSSGGSVTLTPHSRLYVPVRLREFASTNGCRTLAWAPRIQAAIPEVNLTATPTVVVLPANAGGGACARWTAQVLARGCALSSSPSSPCLAFVRSADPAVWTAAIGGLLGAGPVWNATTTGSNPGPFATLQVTGPDVSDGGAPTGTWRRFSGPSRVLANWSSGLTQRTVPSRAETALVPYTQTVGPDDLLVIQPPDGSKPAWRWMVSYRSPSAGIDAVGLAPAHAGAVFVHAVSTAFLPVPMTPPAPPTAVTPATSLPAAYLLAVLPRGASYVNHAADFTVEHGAGNESSVVTVYSCRSGTPTGTLSYVTPEFFDVVTPVVVTMTMVNTDVRCAPRTLTATLTHPVPAVLATSARCVNVTVVMRPDIKPLEQSYTVVNSNGRVILQGRFWSNSTVYCAGPDTPLPEPLTAVFSDAGGDGYCCTMGGDSGYTILVNGVVVKRGGEFAFRETVPLTTATQWIAPAVPAGGTAVVTATVLVTNVPNIPFDISAIVS